MSTEIITVQYDEMVSTLESIMVEKNFPGAKARQCAETISRSTCDGVISHGIARFSRLINQAAEGTIDVNADPEVEAAGTCIQRWDGKHGIGICNALAATDVAVEMAEKTGLGLLALRNTSHWLRAGSYGWQAAERGCALICWTNTMPNMPPWGAKRALIGNNPLVIAVPSSQGHFVMDMAMSQFSYGALGEYSRNGKSLPVPGGTASDGSITDDPDKILETGLVLPTGFWKGTALSIVLDVLAASLSLGSGTADISPSESSLCQIFLAISMDGSQAAAADALREQLLRQFEETEKAGDGAPRYPGQRIPELRRRNMADGIPVPAAVWDEILSL